MLCTKQQCDITMFSTGRGDTARFFLEYLGPRRLRKTFGGAQ